VGVLVILIVAVIASIVPQLVIHDAEAQVPCIEHQDPFWATYTGGEEGCAGAAYDCQVVNYDCG